MCSYDSFQHTIRQVMDRCYPLLGSELRLHCMLAQLYIATFLALTVNKYQLEQCIEPSSID